MVIRCSACQQENRSGSKYCLRCGARLDVPADADPLVGQVLSDRYRVLAVIGEGGMGRVYRAEQQLGTATRNVAVKLLHATHSRDATLRKRFYRECEVVAHLTHPNTIQFYDFGELDDARLFIVMELIEGHSLADALLAGPMPLARVDRIVTQIAGSLSEAHARGVVHRDLKPDNILLTTRGDEHDFVKVCDFGIAKREEGGGAVSQLTLQGTVVGTPRYMSPEQLTGGELDARSDVYSFALIVYEMLTGACPFDATSAMEWAAHHTTREPTPLESFPAARDLPAHTKHAVMRALAKLPAERPPTARAFAAELLGKSDRTPTPISAPAAPVPDRPIDVTAPTLHASPVALRKADLAVSSAPMLRPAGVRSRVWVLAGALAAIGLAGGAAGVAVLAGALDGGPAGALPDAGPPPIDAAISSDAGPPEPVPREWIRIVHQQRLVTDAALALGPPDGRHALVRPRGTLTLEIAAGRRIATDEGTGPDVWIVIDEARSGAYRADVGADRNQYTTVGSELVGSLPLDVDQFEITRIRYVRIKNRSRQDLYLDAVGAAHTVRAP